LNAGSGSNPGNGSGCTAAGPIKNGRDLAGALFGVERQQLAQVIQ
jgi:hypothetical protein